MKSELVKKKVKKKIKINLDKCIGCRACELVCSAIHAKPKYSSINPARSRIRVVIDIFSDAYVPIIAAEYSKAECVGRNDYTINGKTYSECSFCGASCPSRDIFREPDSGLPLKCDLCESESGPMCVKVCTSNALVYEEREFEVKEEDKYKIKELSEMELGLKSLVDRYGSQKIVNSIVRMTKKA